MKKEEAELLSRLIDDDLDGADRRRLEARLRTDSSLSVELEKLRENRDALAEVARRMAPPQRLDMVVEPLRVPGATARHPRRHLLLAAAAILLIAVGIALLAQRPTPRAGAVARALPPAETGSEEREIFRLSPLPTSPVPEEEQPLGAADRLLSRPLPDPPPIEPEPLEVLGPLEAPPATAGEAGASGTALRIPSRGVTRAIDVPLELLAATGSLSLELRVESGQVSGISTGPSNEEIVDRLRGFLIGLPLAGIADGTYRAEVVPRVDDGSSAPR